MLHPPLDPHEHTQQHHLGRQQRKGRRRAPQPALSASDSPYTSTTSPATTGTVPGDICRGLSLWCNRIVSGRRQRMNTPLSPHGAERTDGSSVRIGALVPLTRPGWVEEGQHLLAGLELAAREVNDAGGIVGRPLELVVRDTAADPRRAAAAVDELARLGVAAVAGEYHSVVARAAAARADALGLPFLCSSAVLDALTEQPTDWVARLAPAQSHGWQIYAGFLLSAGHSRIAVAAESSIYWASGARILRDSRNRAMSRVHAPCARSSPRSAQA
jgi:ABC-type branched-subunit amino acid transport system substrate-binding protein